MSVGAAVDGDGWMREATTLAYAKESHDDQALRALERPAPWTADSGRRRHSDGCRPDSYATRRFAPADDRRSTARFQTRHLECDRVGRAGDGGARSVWAS